jgi:cytochrome c oxidase subunit 6a
MSLVAARSLARTLAVRRSAVSASVSRTSTQFRSIQTVPKIGTEAEMQAEAIEQVRARIAYQKEVMAANPHKSHDEEWTELWLWIKMSIFVAGPGCLVMMAKDGLIEEHHHRPDGPMPEYMSIRAKEFPWECDQCALFDLDCWGKCRAEKA